MVMPTPVLPGSSCRAWPGLESGCAPAPRPCLCPRQPCARPWPLSDSYPYLWEVPSDHPFLLIPGPGQQGEETLHSRFSGDRKVPSSACNLCGCLSSQQPLGTGQDCFWSQRTGQDGGGLCEWDSFPGASSLRVSTPVSQLWGQSSLHLQADQVPQWNPSVGFKCSLAADCLLHVAIWKAGMQTDKISKREGGKASVTALTATQ